MKLSSNRIPLAIALSTAVAFAVGCNRNVETAPGVPTADERAAQTTQPAPMDTTAPGDARYGDARDPAMGDDGRRSDQPVNDTWITTKVKSSLLADTDVAGLDIDVDTVNGVVTLSGRVDQQAQIEHATRIARDIEGVTDVRTTALVVGRN